MASNPMLSERAFGGTAVLDRPAPAPATDFPASGRGAVGAVDRTMTYGGTASAAGLMLAVLCVAAWFGWRLVEEASVVIGDRTIVDVRLTSVGLFWAALIVGLVLAVVTAFKPMIARFTALPYAIAQGLVVGAITHLYDARFDGIALQAVMATLGVFLVMLVLYGLRVLRATPRFVKGVVAATFGIMAMYLVGWIASLFGADLRFWSSASPLGIGISVVIVIVAALNLIVDFDVIERGVTQRAPAAMEWYGAFALVVTLVWLYLELLRLLSKLRSR